MNDPAFTAPAAPAAPYLRLRQICLVAQALDPVVDDLCAVFGVEVCHRDPEVGQFGLHNALMPFGQQFIEVVAPIQPDTAAGRYLARRGGDGGYMVILDTEALPRWKAHVAAIGVRVAAPLALGDYEGLQLHPRDTGGALLELNTTLGGAAMDGPYWPAGPHWQQHVRTARVAGIAAAVLQAPEPGALAARWSQILQRPVAGEALALDNATLRFVPDGDGRGEGLSALVLHTRDAAAIEAAARARGLPCAEGTVQVGGVRFVLQPA
ncbi:VOC family protein [uncultured Pseudacidovorax sp.]|uniref:VOC family protein n=1 Tax=uncultured Pseudacidovorax sp. TaxID=679313 RepID=UPI0025E457C5|nr:VOC family protein [uncultured Pseudacidovorax sp.]